jgi:hypothetical protein
MTDINNTDTNLATMFITEYSIRTLVADLPVEYIYYSKAQFINIASALKALKKRYVYEVKVHTLH